MFLSSGGFTAAARPPNVGVATLGGRTEPVLGAGDVEFERLVDRSRHRVGHVHTTGGTADLVGAAVLGGVGLAAGAADAQCDAVDIAQRNGFDGRRVGIGQHGADAAGNTGRTGSATDGDVDRAGGSGASDLALDVLIFTVDEHLGVRRAGGGHCGITGADGLVRVWTHHHY